MNVHTGGRLEVLDEEACLRLLGRNGLGRLGVVVGDQPLVLPVNYATDGRDIVFRSDPGTKLYGAVGNRVAFEIDGIDLQYHEGWSVLVVGIAEEVRDPQRLRAYERLPLVPWVAGPKTHWIRITGGAITGRRITHDG